jgi:hypothetical protein
VLVELEDERVEPVAEQGEPARARHHAVEAISIRDEKAPAVARDVACFLADRDAAEIHTDVVTRRLVVIARHIHHLRALARLAQDFLHDVVVQLVPVPAPFQLPAVDDVADEVQVVGLGDAQELEQGGDLASRRAEVAIGDEDRAKAQRVVGHGQSRYAAKAAALCRRRDSGVNPLSLNRHVRALPPPTLMPAPHRFRGPLQRCPLDAGPLAGTACDHAFNEDWSLSWRVIAGPEQGRVGRARVFLVQPVRAQLFLVSFVPADGESVTAAVDFASRRFVGFRTSGERTEPFSGSVRAI